MSERIDELNDAARAPLDDETAAAYALWIEGWALLLAHGEPCVDVLIDALLSEGSAS